MRLLYVIDSIGRGGAETSLGAMAPGLLASGIELHVATLSATRLHQQSRLLDAGASVYVPTYQAGRAANVRWLTSLARHVKPDLIHTTLFEADIAGRIAAKLLGIPSSTSIVNDSYSSSHYRESNRLKLDAARALDAVTATFARKFHAITRSIAESVGPRIGVPQSRIDVVPRGREPQDYPYRSLAARIKVRDELSISASARVVLAVGRHEPQKGLQHLMDALPQIAASLPETVVLLAGKEGRSSPDLRERASLSGLDVRFLGHRTDVADVLSASDVFCFPSEREGFGGALIEAMAVGCPIVASNIPTTREVLSQRDPVGVMTPVGDPDALAHALTHLLTNQAERESMASRARTRFENSYTIDAVTRDMSDFFFGCLATADNKPHARLGTQPSRASSEEPLDRTGR